MTTSNASLMRDPYSPGVRCALPQLEERNMPSAPTQHHHRCRCILRCYFLWVLRFLLLSQAYFGIDNGLLSTLVFPSSKLPHNQALWKQIAN